MSAGALAATLAVAFVGGGLGAIAGPWLHHRLGKSAHLAQRREHPYARLLAAAADLTKSVQRLPDVRQRPVWIPSIQTLLEALDAADDVSSPEVRKLTHDLWLAASGAHHAGRLADDVFDTTFDDDPEEPSDELEVALAHARDHSTRATVAYERLRDQVQRETRG